MLHERSLPPGGVLHVDVHVLPGLPVKGGGVSLMQLPSLTPGPNGEHDELLLRQLLSFKKLKAFLFAVICTV